MGIDRKLARIALPVLLATASQSLAVAGRSGPAGSTATSHRSASSATAKPAEATHGAKSPVTISFTSSMRHGNLVVMLDGVPVFNEEFQKPLLIISQTTTWDPVQVSAGKHKLTAKVYGPDVRFGRLQARRVGRQGLRAPVPDREREGDGREGFLIRRR